MILKQQKGTALSTLILVIGAAALTAMMSTILVSMHYVKQSKNELMLHSSYSAYESCLGLYSNTIDKVTQSGTCGYGQCLNLITGVGCVACGSNEAKFPVGDDCDCQLSFKEVIGNDINLIAIGSCNKGGTEFKNSVTMEYCLPSCVGLCGGGDGCGGTCPNICVAPDLTCASDNMTCCDFITPCF